MKTVVPVRSASSQRPDDATTVVLSRPWASGVVLAPAPRPASNNATTVACAMPAQADHPSNHQAQLRAVTISEQPSRSKAPVASFTSIKNDTADQFAALTEAAQNSATSRADRRERTTQQQRAALRAWRNAPTAGPRFSMSAPSEDYAAAQGERPKSLMEELLPPGQGLRQKLDPFSGAFRDPDTGLYVELKKLPSKQGTPYYAMCITGTGRGEAIRAQMATNFSNFLGIGGVPPAYRQAATLAAVLQKTIADQGGELCVVGHSLGGGIANYVGLKTNLNTSCYNPAALGSACLGDLEKTGCMTNDRQAKQKIIRMNRDPVSSKAVQKILVAFIFVSTYFHARLPRSIGQVYQVPKNKSPDFVTAIDTHRLRVFEPAYRTTD